MHPTFRRSRYTTAYIRPGSTRAPPARLTTRVAHPIPCFSLTEQGIHPTSQNHKHMPSPSPCRMPRRCSAQTTAHVSIPCCGAQIPTLRYPTRPLILAAAHKGAWWAGGSRWHVVSPYPCVWMKILRGRVGSRRAFRRDFCWQDTRFAR